MPKTTTAEFDREWSDPHGSKGVYKIEYKRRYWNGAAFVWEGAATELNKEEIKAVSTITWKYDTPVKTRILASNVTLTLSNEEWKWLPGNGTTGLWQSDATATLGYVPFRTEFTIYYGYELPDGTEELLALFTGEVKKLKFSSKNNLAVFSLTGRELRLMQADAQRVTTDLTDQSAGVGDGTIVQFDTSQKSVWRISEVRTIAGITVTVGVDDKLDFTEGGGELNATLTAAAYPVGATSAEAGTLCKEIKTQLEATGAQTYTVTYSYTTRKFTITQDTGGTFSILWKTGTNGSDGTDIHCGTLLGYSDAADDTGATAYVADTATTSAAQTQGDDNDFTLDQINEAEINALIDFEVGSTPADKTTVIWTGKQWLIDQQVATLVGLLCDESGIGSGIRTILEPEWPAAASFVQADSQADWESGTLLADIETANSPGSIEPWNLLDNFKDGDYTNNPTWTQRTQQGNGAIVVTGGDVAGYARVTASATNNWIGLDTPFTQHTGFYRFQVNIDSLSAAGSSNGGDGSYVMFFQVEALQFNNLGLKGYGLRFNLNADGGSTSEVQLMRFDDTHQSFGTVLASCGDIPAGENVYEITRDGAGAMVVYINDVNSGSATDNTYTTNAFFAIGCGTTNSTAAIGMRISSIRYGSTATPPYESEAFDLLAAPSAWSTLSYSQTLNGGTIAYKTNVSADGAAWDGWVALGAGDIVASALKRYIKFQVTFTPVGTSTTFPVVEKVRVNYFSTDLFIKSADFSDMTCFDAIAELAKMSGSVFMFEGDGTFIFRSRAASGAEDFTFDQGKGIKELSLDMGYDRVVNVGQCSYGSGSSKYFAEYGATEAAEASPTSEDTYGAVRRQYDARRFFFSNNADIAGSVAQLIYDKEYLPRRIADASIRITPQMNLSDRLKISFYDDPLLEDVVFGDMMQPPYPPLGVPQNVMLRDVSFEATGLSIDIMKSDARLTAEEIL